MDAMPAQELTQNTLQYFSKYIAFNFHTDMSFHISSLGSFKQNLHKSDQLNTLELFIFNPAP